MLCNVEKCNMYNILLKHYNVSVQKLLLKIFMRNFTKYLCFLQVSMFPSVTADHSNFHKER